MHAIYLLCLCGHIPGKWGLFTWVNTLLYQSVYQSQNLGINWTWWNKESMARKVTLLRRGVRGGTTFTLLYPSWQTLTWTVTTGWGSAPFIFHFPNLSAVWSSSSRGRPRMWQWEQGSFLESQGSWNIPRWCEQTAVLNKNSHGHSHFITINSLLPRIDSR